MSTVVSMFNHRARRDLDAAKAEIAGDERIDAFTLPDPETAHGRALYYRTCELILAAFRSGSITAGDAITELQDTRLAWLEDGYAMRQLVLDEICREAGLEAMEVVTWER